MTQAAATGVIRHLEVLTAEVRDVEHHVVLPDPRRELGLGAVFDSAAADAIRGNGAQVHHVDMRRAPLHPANAIAVRRLRILIDEVDADVVHAHSSIAGVTARLAARGTGRPVAYTPHGLNAARRPGPRLVERGLSHLTDVLVAVSESERWEACALGLRAHDGISVIPNGITTEAPRPAVDPRPSLGLPPGAPLVAMVARLAAPKDPVMFAQVCAEVTRVVPDAHFLLVGSGPLQEQLDRAVISLGIVGNWHQLAEVPDASTLMPHLDVMALCTASEGCPYAPLEAMRAGTPVVLTDVTGCRDIVEHGISGFLSPLGDPGRMASHVVSLLTQPDLRARVSAAGQRRVETEFNRDRMGAAYSSLYRRLAWRPGPATLTTTPARTRRPGARRTPPRWATPPPAPAMRHEALAGGTDR